MTVKPRRYRYKYEYLVDARNSHLYAVRFRNGRPIRPLYTVSADGKKTPVQQNETIYAFGKAVLANDGWKSGKPVISATAYEFPVEGRNKIRSRRVSYEADILYSAANLRQRVRYSLKQSSYTNNKPFSSSKVPFWCPPRFERPLSITRKYGAKQSGPEDLPSSGLPEDIFTTLATLDMHEAKKVITRRKKSQWTQQGFQEFKDSWTPERREADEKRLRDIFNAAADVPILKEALKWATQNGVQVFIDHTCAGVGGYYQQGTGIVAISKTSSLDLQDAVRVLTHEIRHAWQDAHGLVFRREKDFVGIYIHTALIEADAYAHEKRAWDEYEVAQLKKIVGKYPELEPRLKTLQASLSSEDYLQRSFLAWTKVRAESYGNDSSRFYGSYLGIPGIERPDWKTELPSEIHSIIVKSEFDIDRASDVARLSRGFFGNHEYMDRRFLRDAPSGFLSHSLAATFYNAANNNQQKLVTEIRKIILKNALQNRYYRRPQRLPLPR